LRALRDLQEIERIEAGAAYTESGYVVVNEVGEPPMPDRYSREFLRVAGLAEVPRISPRDVRRTANSMMADLGVPPHIRASYLGHSKMINEDVYTAADMDGLKAARDALAEVFKTSL
jgi:integrase